MKSTGGAGVPGPRKSFCFAAHTGKHAPAGTAQAAGYSCGCDLIAPAKKACFSVLARPVQAAFFAQKSGRANRHSTGRFSAGRPAPRGLRCRRAGFFPQWRRDIRRMRHSVQGRAPRRMCAWRTLRRTRPGHRCGSLHSLSGQAEAGARARNSAEQAAAVRRCRALRHGTRGTRRS